MVEFLGGILAWCYEDNESIQSQDPKIKKIKEDMILDEERPRVTSADVEALAADIGIKLKDETTDESLKRFKRSLD